MSNVAKDQVMFMEEVDKSTAWMKLRKVATENPLRCGFGLWGSIMVGTGIYLWRYKSHRPLSQNIIHARLVAQFGVLAGIITGGVINYLELPSKGLNSTSEERLQAITLAHQAAFREELAIEEYEKAMAAQAASEGLPEKEGPFAEGTPLSGPDEDLE